MSNNVIREPSLSAYDSIKADQDTPITQISAKYGLLGEVFTVSDAAASGTNTVVNDLFTCKTGVSSAGLASILTLRQIGVKPGQGTISRFDAIFTPGVAGSQQAAGLITSENSYVFAFLGTAFGIAYAHGGVSEEQELTITTPASGSETATINIDGNPFSVPLTVGTVQHNALEIAESLDSQVLNYNFTSNNDQVVAQSILSGTQGSFSFSSSTAVAAWAQQHAGVSAIIEFTPQASWNEDTRTAPAVAPELLDPTKLNVYLIQVGENSGSVSFFIQDSDTGLAVLVHTIKAANLNTITNTTNPTFRLGWLAQNLGSTTDITIAGNEAGAFIEGKIQRSNTPRSDNNNQLSVGTSLVTIMTFRNRIHFGGKVNRVEIFPNLLAASSQANKSTFFIFLANPVFAGDLDFFYIDKDESVMEAAIESVGVSGGRKIGSLTIEPDGSETLRFNQTPNQDTIILPGEVFSIAAFAASGAGGDMQTTFTWQEDI